MLLYQRSKGETALGKLTEELFWKDKKRNEGTLVGGSVSPSFAYAVSLSMCKGNTLYGQKDILGHAILNHLHLCILEDILWEYLPHPEEHLRGQALMLDEKA